MVGLRLVQDSLYPCEVHLRYIIIWEHSLGMC